MFHKRKISIILTLLILSAFCLTACGNDPAPAAPTPTVTAPPTDPQGSEPTSTPTAVPTDSPAAPTEVPLVTDAGVTPEAAGELTAKFTNFDKNATFDAQNPSIQFNGATATVTGEGAVAEGNKLTISKEGTYVLSGTWTDGQVYVNVSKQEKVHLVLNGADITCTYGPAIYIANADKASITLADGTENTLTDAASYSLAAEDNANSCIYSKDDLSINGTGRLTVNGNFNNGIDSSNDLRIVSGTIQVTAKNHGIKGNDSIGISGGTITVKAAGDGLKASTEKEPDKGYFHMTGGTLDITAGDDGIQAVTSILISGGSISFHVTDDKTNCDGTTVIADNIIK